MSVWVSVSGVCLCHSLVCVSVCVTGACVAAWAARLCLSARWNRLRFLMSRRAAVREWAASERGDSAALGVVASFGLGGRVCGFAGGT